MGTENKAAIRLVYSGNFIYNRENVLMLKALNELLKIKIADRLKETEDTTFTSSVRLRTDKYPANRYVITVSIKCTPGNVEKLIKATKEEIFKLQENGGSEEELDKFKTAKQSEWREGMKNNDLYPWPERGLKLMVNYLDSSETT